ncbi:hypothetical protein M0812_02051 [Anaeramoeba flamelloides]|uniref:Uncharacterized protein n=1 Tax=Anaeramoeba flamelloides TaxID=1746091 RepID=A0AAV7YZH2_9EUKA|nr:hypothetical protein M0812_02051 [Anaeramoeba flamelloides]
MIPASIIFAPILALFMSIHHVNAGRSGKWIFVPIITMITVVLLLNLTIVRPAKLEEKRLENKICAVKDYIKASDCPNNNNSNNNVGGGGGGGGDDDVVVVVVFVVVVVVVVVVVEK